MKDFFVPCLELLAGSARNAKDCLPDLQRRFALTDAEMEEFVPSGTRRRVFDRADWAIFHLMKAGLVDRPQRGVYVTSSAGLAWLREGAKPLTVAQLKAMPAYLASEAAGTEGVSPGTAFEPADQTPEELISKAISEIDTALVIQLLGQLQTVTPTRFEQIIVDLLLAMGYGGGDRSMGERLGKTGDGGIDGIINEDKLGLDAVYIQAKRYAPGNTVGRPTLQAFVGSLTGEGATKGVFVTTSDFSKDARDYLNKVQHRIVLINGDRLARLLIQHDVGVRPRKTYVIRSIDEDYFSED